MATEALVLKAAPSIDSSQRSDARVHTPGRARVNLGGVLIDQLDFDSAVACIRGLLLSGSAHHVVTVNLDFLSIAQRDPVFRQTLNNAALAVADGMPLVWVSRLREQHLPERLAGVELVDASCQIAAETGRSVFLLGAAPGVADQAAVTLRARFPNLRIAGTYSPPAGALTDAENQRIVEMVRSSAPGFLFVALGAPRQDLWIREHLSQLKVPVAMGVGCVFDLLAGEVQRAPVWMRRSGLEWAFRLFQEPARLWRRYLLNDVPMLGRLLMESGSDPQPALSHSALGGPIG